MAFSGSQVTRLGVSGFPRPPYGSFANKATADVAVTGGFYQKLRNYVLPDGRRLRTTTEEIQRLLVEYFKAEEAALEKKRAKAFPEKVAVQIDEFEGETVPPIGLDEGALAEKYGIKVVPFRRRLMEPPPMKYIGVSAERLAAYEEDVVIALLLAAA